MHLPKNDSATKHKKESSTNRTEPSSETNNDDAPFGAAEHLNRLYAQRCLYPESVYNRFQKSIFEKPNFLGNRDSLKGVKVTYEDRTGNATFLKGNELLTLMIFGELAPMSEGTRVTAIGNHYPWSEPVSSCFRRVLFRHLMYRTSGFRQRTRQVDPGTPRTVHVSSRSGPSLGSPVRPS